MPRNTPEQTSATEPIFVSVKEAAAMLALKPISVYRLCDDGSLVSQYAGKRRLVRLESVRAYADGLPTERPTERPAS